ncbi:metallophosphoesterase family protein [soil metagenome]
MMYKIAHITDLHLKKIDVKEHKKRAHELLESIKENNCDHVLLTGDIVDNTEDKDFKSVRRMFKKYDLLDPEKLSVTIGNHDLFGGPTTPDNLFYFPTKCKTTDYNAAVTNFFHQFRETFKTAELFGGPKVFPYQKIVLDKVAVIGVNSVAMWSKIGNPVASNGAIYTEQYENLKEILHSEKIKDKFKIVLIHHHFNKIDKESKNIAHSLWLKIEQRTMRLHNKKRLFRLFKAAGVKLILHGHTHICESYTRKGSMFVNSSGCVVPFTENKIRQYNIINIPKDPSNMNYKIETINLKSNSDLSK